MSDLQSKIEANTIKSDLRLSKVLTRIILLCMLPLFLFGAILATLMIDKIQQEQIDKASLLARNVVLYTDNAISSRINALNMLATSSFVDDVSQWHLLYQSAQNFQQSFGTHVVITDGNTQPQLLMSTLRPFGVKLPVVKDSNGRMAGPIAMRTGRPAVSDLFYGPIDKNPLIGIAVPVIREGIPKCVILTVLSKDFFQDQIQKVSLPQGWHLALKDAQEQIIAQLNQPSAEKSTSRVEASSMVSNWKVEVEISPIAQREPILSVGIALAAILFGATLTGFLSGKWAGRRVGSAIESLATKDSSDSAVHDAIMEIAAARRLINQEAERRIAVENVLRQKMLEYEAMFERSVVGKAQADPTTGRFLKVNRAFADMLGYSPDELCRMTTLEITHPDDQEQELQGGQTVRPDNAVHWHNEIRYRKKDGTDIWVSVTANVIHSEDKKCTLAVIQDIGERRKAEEALKQSEELFRRLFDFAPLGKVLTGPDGTFERVNPAFCQMLGYSPEELANLSFLDITHPDDVPLSEEGVSTLLAGKQDTWDTQNRYLAKAGQVVWTRVVTTLLRNAVAQPIQFLTHILDITELKKTEAELRNSNKRSDLMATVAQRLLGAENPQSIVEELCRMVMEHIDCQFFFNYLVDIPGQRMELNAFAGIPAATAATIRQLDFGVAVCGCAARDKQRIIAEHIDTGDDMRTQLVKSFGVRAYCCHPLMIEGELLGTLSFGTRTRPIFTSDEISLMKAVADHVALAMHRMLATQALHESEERIRVSLMEKDVLLKEIHHRVKNNMQVISSLVELQADQFKDEAMHWMFNDIIFRVRSMAMVHEKLYQSHDFAHVDFANYADSLIGYLWQAQARATLHVALKVEMEHVLLPVNEAVPCGLMLNELFTNALKHAFVGRESGELTVRLRSDEQGKVVLSVKDDGIGLPPEMDIKKVRTLGLRLVQMLARQLHASVDAQENNGTTFTITFEVPEHEAH